MLDQTRPEARRFLPLLALALAGVMCLAACGGSEDSDESGGSGGPEAAEESSQAGATPETPLAIGETVEVYGWEVTVTDVQMDATDAIREHFSITFQEPSAGHRYAVVTLDGTWVGEEEHNAFYSEVLVRFRDGETEYAEPCATPDPGLDWTTSVPQGETITSTWCVEIPEDLSDDAVIELRDYIEWVNPPESQYFFETP